MTVTGVIVDTTMTSCNKIILSEAGDSIHNCHIHNIGINGDLRWQFGQMTQSFYSVLSSNSLNILCALCLITNTSLEY